MKKVFLVVLLILSLFTLGCAKKTTPTKQPENTLYVYNWEDYISPQVIENFEKYYEQKYGKKVKVVYTTFDTNETNLQRKILLKIFQNLLKNIQLLIFQI